MTPSTIKEDRHRPRLDCLPGRARDHEEREKRGQEGGLHYARLMTDIQSGISTTVPVIAGVKDDLGYAGLGYDNSADVVEGSGRPCRPVIRRNFPPPIPPGRCRRTWPSSTGLGRKVAGAGLHHALLIVTINCHKQQIKQQSLH